MSKVTVDSLVYHVAGKAYESRLFYTQGAKEQPGLLMAPNWMGVGEGAERIARDVAAQGYVVLLADIYGQTLRPSNMDEAGAAMMPLKDDRVELRKRLKAALDQLLGQSKAVLEPGKLVMEVKFTEFCPQLVRDMVPPGAAELTAVSKYCLCYDKTAYLRGFNYWESDFENRGDI